MKKNAFHECLLFLAKASIKEFFQPTETLNKTQWLERFPQLNTPQATFVTLTINDNLRGCIGSLIARRSLYDDIISNAKAAAFNDPRFKPLSVEEFDTISVEISLLSEPQAVEYSTLEDLKSKINRGDDGVILQYGHHQATFLPQVWEQLPTFELFFEYLCNKAGVSLQCLEDHATIYTYKVEKFK